MAHVADILATKGTTVHTIDESTSVLEATRLMNAARIGAMVVTDERAAVVGIFTERDVLRRVVAEKRDPATTNVGSVMTNDVVCCETTMPINEVQTLMKQQRIRHLPVVDGTGKLSGLVSIGDVNAHLANGAQVQIQYLNDYIYGRA